MTSEIRWNSKQQFYIQDYFAADNRFGFCNSGNGQVRILCLIHTPSNILFSRAFSDTSYNDLMKISYTGDTTIYSTSESATSTAGGGVWSGDKREVNINDNMDVSSCLGRRGQQPCQGNSGLYIIGFHNRSFGSNTLSVTTFLLDTNTL
jgi:hypothetical protein